MQPEEVELPVRPAPVPELVPASSRSRWKALLVVLVVGAVLAAGGVLYWNYAATYQSTDDAQVGAHLNGISARIAGTVTGIHADENQFVKAGQLVAELDPNDYQVALDEARAEMSQKQAEVRVQDPSVPIIENTNETGILAAQADVANAEAAVALAERDYAAAQARLREAEANATKAQADVNATQADGATALHWADFYQRQLQAAQAKQADAQVAKTRVNLAQLNLSYTKIYAPVSGVVSKRNVEIGNHVQPGQQLFLIAQIDDLWVTANFKETQLRRIRPNQKVTISVDAFGQKFHGYVESMPAATGTVTSLLPPENASGNYVKVVQRLPVRIRFDNNQAGLDRLVPGMSVEPTVWIR